MEMASHIRRKPSFTYKSPTAEDHSIITLRFPRRTHNQAEMESTPGPSSSTSSPTSRTKERPQTSRRKRPMTPSLPLFHPLGQLAMSLPPLDPAEYGLPDPSVPDDAEGRSAARLKRPSAKSRDTEEDLGAVTATVSAIVAVAAQEVRERASPRKRRTGGAKRKRRDGDDGDATYPAKRTRIPRGGGGQAADDDAVDIVPPIDGAPNIPEALADLNDTLKRRSTRAKTSMKRRDSSSSETASVSPSANGLGKTEANASSAMTEPKEKADVADQLPIENNDEKAEKEEGELSEEQNA